MNLNLYDPNEFTKDGVRRLLASKRGDESDRELYQLRVTKYGMAYIEHEFWTETEAGFEAVWDNHALVFSWWDSSYVGKDAANDDAWVTHVYDKLKFWWNECLKFGPHKLPDAFYAC